MSPTKTLITPEEYLHTSFEGLDREYVDGEIVERAMPTTSHGRLQLRFGKLFDRFEERHLLYAMSEVRHRLSENRYRIPDIAVHHGQVPADEVPTEPPLVAIEIVSPEDRLTALLDKLEEYFRWGVAHVWLVDPVRREMAVYDASGFHDVPELTLPEYGISFTPQDVFGA